MVKKKPFVVTKPTPKPSAHDFTLKRDEWERAVFLNADHFSIVVFRDGLRYRANSTSLLEAVALGNQYDRALIYAITKEGRATLLPRAKWNELIEEWTHKHGPAVSRDD